MTVFRRTALLRSSQGQFLCLVTDGLEDGPLNLRIAGWPFLHPVLHPGLSCHASADALWLGTQAVSLRGTQPVSPFPDWNSLRQRWQAALCSRDAAPWQDPLPGLPDSLSPLLERPAITLPLRRRLEAGLEALLAGLEGDSQGFTAAAERLTGLGPGLTPAGDDVLSGAMLRFWLEAPEPAAVCAQLLQGAEERTSSWSAALLAQAATGACSRGWMRLLSALVEGDQVGLIAAADQVRAYGATSGAFMLAGFRLAL